jgi:hypothetical protein
LQFDGWVWLGLPAAVSAAAALNLLAAITAAPVAFAADTRRPERATQSIRGYFVDTARLWRNAETRGTLLALASLRAVVTGGTGAFIAVMLSDDSQSMADHLLLILRILVWILLGAACGSLVAGVQRHPRRALGLVPLGATGLAVGFALAAGGYSGHAVGFLLGAMGGLMNVPLAATYQIFLPADARGNGMAVRNMFDYALMAAMSVLLFGLARSQGLDGAGQLWLVAILTTGGALCALWKLYRDTIEQLTEIVLWPFYRIRGHGPGLNAFPQRGPLLVVANHAAWFDPVWMAKVLPRSLRPMMTSTFYDLPFLRWLMKNVARVGLTHARL